MSVPEQNLLIKAAEDELASLLAEDAEIEGKRAEVRKKIAVVSQALETLRRVYGKTNSGLGAFGELINANLGITDHVRQILKSEYPVYLRPTTIRDYLEHHGFLKNKDDEEYANPLALIHQILKRLDVAGEIQPLVAADGAKLYRWKPESSLPILTAAAVRMYQPNLGSNATGVINDPVTVPPGRTNVPSGLYTPSARSTEGNKK